MSRLLLSLQGLNVYSKNSLETKLSHDKAMKSISHVQPSKHVNQTAHDQCNG